MELNIPAEIERLSKDYIEFQKSLFQIEGQIRYLRDLMAKMAKIETETPVENDHQQAETERLNES